MKIISKFFTLYRGLLYTAIISYLLVAIAPIIFGIQPFMVVSASMEPTIETGALAYVNKKDVDVNTGDIIAFEEGTGEKITVIHRIISEGPDGTYVTKGDANADEDFAPINANQVVGKVVFNIPKLGYVTNFLQSTKGIVIAIIFIVISLVSSFITDMADSDEEEESEETSEKDELVNTTSNEESTSEENSVSDDSLLQEASDEVETVAEDVSVSEENGINSDEETTEEEEKSDTDTNLKK